VPQASLPGLPPNVLEMVTDHLIGQDKLNNAEACARDIGAGVQVCAPAFAHTRRRWTAGGANNMAAEATHCKDTAGLTV
jgi:hypothetical protein